MSALPPDGETPLRVVLVDDHAVVRTGYRRLMELEPGIAVIAEFDDGDRAYAWLCGHPADVLVLDLSMPGRGGLATLRRVHQRLPALRVLVFSMHEHPALAMQALRFCRRIASFVNRRTAVCESLNGAGKAETISCTRAS